MAHLAVRPSVNCAVTGLVAALTAVFGLGTPVTPQARADGVAYLVNVAVRPGYNFPNADAALAYGHGMCEKVAAARAREPVADSRKLASWIPRPDSANHEEFNTTRGSQPFLRLSW